MTDSTGTIDELLAHSGWLRGLAQRLVGESSADDVVQEVWLRAAERSPEKLSSPRGWLRATLRTIHFRRVERQSAARVREREVARTEQLPSTADLAGRADAQRRLVEAVLALDDPYRRTVLLRYFEDRSIAEIALDYGDPESTVRTRLARGLAELRETLDRRPGGRESWLSGMALLAMPERVASVSVLTLGSVAVWKAIVAVVSVCLLAWFGRSLLVEEVESPAADVSGNPVTAAPAPGAAQEEVGAAPDESMTPEARVAVATEPEVAEVTAPEVAAPVSGSAITGRVLDPAGSPVEGATVYEGSLAQVALSLRNENNARRPSVVTGEGGVYRLELAAEGAKIVSAWLDGYSSSEGRTVELATGEELAGIDLSLRLGAMLTGIAYGIDGLPVAGRRVQASCTDIGEFREFTTDDAGAFELSALSAGTWLAATFPEKSELEAAGKATDVGTVMSYLSQLQVVLVDGGAEEIALGLPDADSPKVTGKLLHMGVPVAGMMQWYPAARPTEKSVTMVAADGAFSVDLPQPGLWILHANTSSRSLQCLGQRMFLDLAPKASIEFDVDLRGATLTGRVLDAGGSPLERVRVQLRSIAGAAHQPEPVMGGSSNFTDEGGRYAFDLVLPGTYVIVAAGSAAGGKEPLTCTTLSEPVVVKDESAIEVPDLALAGGASVSIQVTDTLGRPVGASIYFHGPAGHPLNPNTSTRSSSQGSTLSPTLPLGPIWITAVHRTGASSTVSVEVGVDEAAELKLGPPLWLELAMTDGVVDPTGGHISVTDAGGRRWGGLVDIRHIFDAKPEREHPERPLFGPLPPGTYTVEVEAGGATRTDVVKLAADSPLVSTASVH